MSRRIALFLFFSLAGSLTFAQDEAPGLKQRESNPPNPGTFRVEPGTRILLNMINSVSTKQAQVGDALYLETAFPVLSGNRIVVPQGSWVRGTVTEVKRPGRVKGRGELQVRFDSLTLPNGTTRSFRADIGALDSRSEDTLNREKNTIKGPGDKKSDIGTITGSTVDGTVVGSGVGAAAGSLARGAGIGGAAGAAAGLLGVLMTRGPDATLTKGSTVEMVLDRTVAFDESELNFSNAPPRAALSDGGPQPKQSTGSGRRFPY